MHISLSVFCVNQNLLLCCRLRCNASHNEKTYTNSCCRNNLHKRFYSDEYCYWIPTTWYWLLLNNIVLAISLDQCSLPFFPLLKIPMLHAPHAFVSFAIDMFEHILVID